MSVTISNNIQTTRGFKTVLKNKHVLTRRTEEFCTGLDIR